ncbi:hypothetical protein HXX76_009238 [Chlamydomonas incerta]|uniref:RING-type domain-containing protein n=1 Tax=Chlamydomonas incerta TaxID=51695 RepID=A0A835VWA5_CHLIN|nr:hypothetical protein HXX76_009238 [Chlamydomonas incerta]|eukprot:KAG2431742.1 hypothetical protein HXX76_009238 [Chlamydomonas incerta]
MVDTYKCGRKGVSSWVCDPDAILTYESANVVEGVIKKIFEGETPYVKTYCGASGQIGYQVAVALMRQMRTTGDPAEYAETFARSLHDRWGVGSSECNNGVVFFLSLNDRQLYISTGAGAKHALSFDVLGDIIADIRPVLREGRFGDAVERGVVNIGLALAGRPVAPGADAKPWGWDDALGLGIFASIVGGLIYFSSRSARRQQRRYSDCKSKLDKLKRDQAALRANSYNPTSCPVCLEDFATDLDSAQRAAEGSAGAAGAAAAERAAAAAAGAGAGGGAAAAGSGGAAGAGLGLGLAHQRSGSVGAAAAAGADVPLQEVGSFSSAGAGASASWGGDGRGGLAGEAAAGAGQDSKGPQLLGRKAAADAEDRELKEPLMSPRADAGSSGTGGAAAAASAAAGGAAAAAGGAAAAPAERRPLVLPCGHAFCEPCIKAWLDQKKVTCPICRRPIDDEDGGAADPNAPGQGPQARRPPGTGTTPRDPNASGAGPSSGSGPSGSAGPRPPCSVDEGFYDPHAQPASMFDTPNAHMYDDPNVPPHFHHMHGPGMGMGMGDPYAGGSAGILPRLRLRWGARRRFGAGVGFGGGPYGGAGYGGGYGGYGGYGYGGRMNEDMLMAEMLFRLRQLQRQHPDFVSGQMLQQWEQDLRQGREFNTEQLRQFQLRDPATRAQLESSGRAGARVNFGGGSSRGGGGRGGSW